jgi:hypothetical protein
MTTLHWFTQPPLVKVRKVRHYEPVTIYPDEPKKPKKPKKPRVNHTSRRGPDAVSKGKPVNMSMGELVLKLWSE